MKLRNRIPIQVGSTFGHLTIVEVGGYHYLPSGARKRLVKVRCDCGNEYETIGSDLRKTGPNRKCRRCSGKEDRMCNIGDKYDKLIVVDYTTILTTNGRKNSMVVCRCECGTQNVIKRARCLIDNKTNNCGCAPRGQWSGVGELSIDYINRTKRSAKKRRLEFDLDIKWLWNLFLQQERKCALTGLPIKLGSRSKEYTASLDRIDSNNGYIQGNVQWVHKIIQRMKWQLNEEEFIKMCGLVYINKMNITENERRK